MEKATLGWSICLLFRAWQSGMADAVSDTPHGTRGYQILEVLAEGGRPTQSELATELGIDRSVLTYVIDDLVVAGVLERQADTRDRRVRRLAITGQGLEKFGAEAARVSSAERELFAGISPDDEVALRRALSEAALSIFARCAAPAECTSITDTVNPRETDVALNPQG